MSLDTALPAPSSMALLTQALPEDVRNAPFREIVRRMNEDPGSFSEENQRAMCAVLECVGADPQEQDTKGTPELGRRRIRGAEGGAEGGGGVSKVDERRCGEGAVLVTTAKASPLPPSTASPRPPPPPVLTVRKSNAKN